MIKKLTLAATAIAMTASGLAATPAAAQRYDDQGYAYAQAYRDGYNRDDGYQDRRGYRDDRRYDDGRRYEDGRRYDDGRRYYNRSRCNSGTTGTILGAIAGGLLGNSIAGRGDRTLGTVLGAGGGALAGRAIEKDGQRCR
ncbi:glycine zipper 2TM domain-containing protein [Sphingomonas glacialis]|uniref:17 kDa surface antigen n=1 Tax=Sphingomonas glacialis TaxID=658225 RepID=A0A502G744_9SPHN|nr:glycine zipper 2TM domain-containing protein [Sphingomonas glacialis]TPG56663.1 glycine zipper 2TM domain-containing protein [Sphingomonas glacialis]